MIKESIEEYVKALNTLAEIQNQQKDRPPFRAPTHLHDFVLKHGEVWQGQKLPSKYRLRPIRRCFQNTYNLVRRSKALTYCEGFVASREIPLTIHHAWAVNPKGKVIDTTLRGWQDLHASGGDRGEYMGVRFPTWFVQRYWDGSMLDCYYRGFRLDVIEAYEKTVVVTGKYESGEVLAAS
jgi:hypothetical protein